jgi:hypothetical protein
MAEIPTSPLLTPPPTQPAPWWAIIGLAYFVLIIFAVGFLLILQKGEMQLSSNMIIAVIGFVSTGLGYYFGSSSSSNKKDDANTALGMAHAVNAANATGPTEPSDAEKALATKLGITA